MNCSKCGVALDLVAHYGDTCYRCLAGILGQVIGAHETSRTGQSTGQQTPQTEAVGQDKARDRKPSKMRNQRTEHKGIRYHSKAEARYAAELDLRKQAGEVAFYLRQVGFDLPGGTRHYVDFMVFYPGEKRYCPWELIEVKGRDLPMGKLKRKQVEEIYGVTIKVVA